MINLLGALANITSLILWIPQAKITWKNRDNKKALSGISYGTQIIVIANTLLWCAYGLSIKNFWLPLGTIIIFPLALMTIFTKYRIGKKTENTNSPLEPWFCFNDYQKLSDDDKKRCLQSMYSTNFGDQLKAELLNYQSYEEMNTLDRMYWDQDLWKNTKET